MKNHHVWIIEMEDKPGHWSATVGCSLNRAEGRVELFQWQWGNPVDKFRLRKYEPAKGDEA